jgi:multicomponent Na+:H+ antiporter subunit E
MRLKTMTHTLGLGLAMFALWLLLSGHYTPLLLSSGVASCALIVLIAARLDVIDHEAVPLHLSFGYFGYLAWLGKEIAKSNWDVAKIVLDPKLPISPTMVWVPATQRTDVGKVIYANSITLTPGTVSVEIEHDLILVHAITREAAEGLESGDMDRRVDQIEAR